MNVRKSSQRSIVILNMAPEHKKRPRPVPASTQKSRKRQKAGHVQDVTGKRPVALDSLPWNEVQMPDMFEDAEGFFGLEEIDGVDVLRDGDTVKFVRAIERSPKTKAYYL
jgi:ATP-dependent RNA helicase DDX24/MAK5